MKMELFAVSSLFFLEHLSYSNSLLLLITRAIVFPSFDHHCDSYTVTSVSRRYKYICISVCGVP